MIGLDTNVLVRYLTKDDLQQWQAADRLIQATLAANDRCFITNIVLCELVWVLRSSYKLSRPTIIETLEKILRTSLFEFENQSAAWQAVQQMKQGSADFSDYLIGEIHQQMGCSETVTFDVKLRNTNRFRLL